ncbi:MAG TPA: asparagine synthase (glutamine-hydrolyzing) [Bacteroidia bacterium]|nr:asparagine synthase (glutamine-hydrolyzing) [Bacteroidia bacterium]
MCGIAGIIAESVSGYRENLFAMMNSLRHRGPDGEGSFFFDQCAFGHRRLSIVDLECGHQPMFNNSKNTAIIFNGEIYGYKKIREQLKDYPFSTKSDTEVILALYEKYDRHFLQHLPGMFSLAIWNEEKKELICARDRFGEKPFYYAYGKRNEFIFASEIKAIIASGLVEPVLDKNSLDHYLKYLYIHPHQTVYKNIFTLPPAHILTLKQGRLKVEKYWELPQTDHKISLQEAETEFKKLFTEAVEKQLVADVPVGAFLSGGLDSSSVVAAASGLKQGLNTFAFAFEQGANELPFAKIIAEKYNTEHVVLEDKHEDIGELLLEMQNVYDEPFADSSNIPTYLISKYAGKYHKVVLTGDGGDEMLGGYTSWYRPLLNLQKKSENNAADKMISQFLKVILSLTKGNVYEKIRNQLNQSDQIKNKTFIAQQHLAQLAFFDDKEIQKLSIESQQSILKNKFTNTVDDAIRMDIENYMPGDILVKTDRASMANNLELRSPFLDVDLASFCISLPYTMKISNETDKIILKNTLREWLPAEILNRKKQGFGAPVNHWLKLKSVAALKRDFLNDKNKKIFSVLPFEIIQKMIQQDDYKTWQLLVLSMWMENHSFKIN